MSPATKPRAARHISSSTFALVILVPTFAALAEDQEDDLGSAFGPPPAEKPFESEKNVPPPPLSEDPNADARAAFEKDLAEAKKAVEKKVAARAQELLPLLEVNAIGLGAPERVRVHQLQHAFASAQGDKAAQKDAATKWLTACGPSDVAACRKAALDALSPHDKDRAERLRAADACLTAAEAKPGKPAPACLDAAAAQYKATDDALMQARAELVRALAQRGKPAKDALLKLAAGTDDRTALVRRSAHEGLAKLALAEGNAELAARHGVLAAGANAMALAPTQRVWARTAVTQEACAAWEKTKGAGACHALEKQLLGDWAFFDFSQRSLEGPLTQSAMAEVNEHYNVLVQRCLEAEIRRLEGARAISYYVRWLALVDGKVDNMHSESTAQDQTEFIKCLRAQFGYWRYPKHEGDPQRVEQGFKVKSSIRTEQEEER